MKNFYLCVLSLCVFLSCQNNKWNEKSIIDAREDSVANLNFGGYDVAGLLSDQEMKTFEESDHSKQLILLNNKYFNYSLDIENDQISNGKIIKILGIDEKKEDFYDLIRLYQSKYGQCSYVEHCRLNTLYSNRDFEAQLFAMEDSFEITSRTLYDEYFKGNNEEASESMNELIFPKIELNFTGYITSIVWEWKNQSIHIQHMIANDSPYDYDDENENCIRIIYKNQGSDVRKELDRLKDLEEQKKIQQNQLLQEKEKSYKDSLKRKQKF